MTLRNRHILTVLKIVKLLFIQEKFLSFEMLECLTSFGEEGALLHCRHMPLFRYTQFHIRLQIMRFLVSL